MKFVTQNIRHGLDTLGGMAIFMAQGVGHVFTNGRIFSRTTQQLYLIGFQSLFLICLIGLFCGMVLGLQGYYTLVQFGSTGLLGSAMAAEIGVMRITEQIDALDVMDINSMAYLVSPRIVACIIAFPLLTAVFDAFGIFGGYLTGVLMLDMSEGIYFYKIAHAVTLTDVNGGFVKALIFGMLVATVCCHQGYFAHLRQDSVGPEAVGNATTSGVVISFVLILAADYVVTSFLL